MKKEEFVHSILDGASPAPRVTQENVASAAFSAENVFTLIATVRPWSLRLRTRALCSSYSKTSCTRRRHGLTTIVVGDQPADAPRCIVQDELAIIVYEGLELAQSGTVDASA